MARVPMLSPLDLPATPPEPTSFPWHRRRATPRAAGSAYSGIRSDSVEKARVCRTEPSWP